MRKEKCVVFTRKLTKILLQKNQHVSDIVKMPNNTVLFTFQHNKDHGDFSPEAVTEAHNYRQLMCCLVYDVPEVPEEQALIEVGNVIRNDTCIFGTHKTIMSWYYYKHHKKDAYMFPEISRVEGSPGPIEHFWFIFKPDCDDLVLPKLAEWYDWVKERGQDQDISYVNEGNGVIKIFAPAKVHDPIMALYMTFIEKKRDKRALQIIVSGGTREEALALKDRKW